MTMMKSSNTEWLGDIPAEWDVAQIGNYYELRNEKVSDYDFEPLSVTMKGIVPQLATAAKSDDHSNRKLVKKGDFVINSRSDRRGSCGISPLDGSVSLINIVMEPRGEMNPQYYNWLFHTEQFADEFYKWGHGIVDDLWTTRWQEMKKILIVAPSPDEQQAIADYLDKTCSKIDEIIAEAKASIDEYKELKQSVIFEAVTKGLDKNVEMKDSGIEWIGEIPVDWVVKKFKYVATVNTNLVSPIGYEDYHQIAPDCIEKDSGRIIKERTVSEAGIESWNQLFKQGQLIYSKIRPILNKVIIAPYYGLCSADMYPLDVHENIYFVQFAMLSKYFVGQVGLITQDRVKMPKINQDELSNVYVAVPEKTEQKEIVDWLNVQLPKYDSLIAEKESLINELKAYKKSLIYEVITGKRRVV